MGRKHNLDPRIDRRHDSGPFDIVGDVHGCYDELRDLLARLGYRVDEQKTAWEARVRLFHPEGRRLVFVGDLVDRGPNTPAVLQLAMDAVDDETALCVVGNHDDKLRRKLAGRRVKIAHGLAESLAQLAETPRAFVDRVYYFLSALPPYLWLDGGRLVVAHAGLKTSLQGSDGERVRDFALYGDTTGEVDDVGLPVRRNWALKYRGRAAVVYGHTYVAQPEWVNNTIDIDTGCVFGGALTALRYPERELVLVPAKRVYWQPLRGPATLVA
jgi:diadenosine tetraphosphatase ApaH/serine/threonine PP2A family protein phosphatase